MTRRISSFYFHCFPKRQPGLRLGEKAWWKAFHEACVKRDKSKRSLIQKWKQAKAGK